MAVESKRACGYRDVHGLYLVTDSAQVVACDRGNLTIYPCSVCGFVHHFSRGVTEFEPSTFFENHDEEECRDGKDCYTCFPPDGKHVLMWVGDGYYPTPQSFIDEVKEMGLSKKIPYLPSFFTAGETVLYLAKENLMAEEMIGYHPNREEYRDGVFMAIKPSRIEYLITESEATDEFLKHLESKNITPIIVPDDDPDHTKSVGRPKFSIDENQKGLSDYF